MTVYVNDKPVDIFPGMTVKHALIGAGLLRGMDASKRVFDEWGNEIGLDGALSEGAKIYVK
jgi:hypothetical protein